MEMVMTVNNNGVLDLPAVSAQSRNETTEGNALPQTGTRRFKLSKLSKLTMVMAFTAILALLSVSYVRDGENVHPQILFATYPESYNIYLVFLAVSFYSSIFSAIIRVDCPTLSWVCIVMSLSGVCLSFTVLLFVLLPPALNWIPCILVALTFGVLVYKHGLFHLLFNKIILWYQKNKDPLPRTDVGDEALPSSTDVI